jgi:Protein of unknown function (DUF1653)
LLGALGMICHMSESTPSAPIPLPQADGGPLPELPVIALGHYRHYKGLDYEVLGVVRHSESLEPMVLYKPLYNASGWWVRPFEMFVGNVVLEGGSVPRFKRL